MLRITSLVLGVFQILATVQISVAQEVLFEDNFDNGLSPKWSIVGLKNEDYRIKDGGLEMRVQPGKATKETPMLMVLLPFDTTETVKASVDLTLIDDFTEPAEVAGLFLTDADSLEFGAKKMNLEGHLVYSPGEVEFIGPEETEGEPQPYILKFWPAKNEFGALRVIVRDGYGYFQVGPSKEGKYLNFFDSALRPNEPKRGFALSTSGGPTDTDHWVRFDNFRVVRDN